MDGAARLRFLLALHTTLRACRRFQARRDTDGLLSRLNAIADPELRLHRFGEILESRSSDAAAWILAEFQRRVNIGEPRARRVCIGLLDQGRLARVVGERRLAAIRAALDALEGSAAGLFGETRRAATEDGTISPPKEPVGFRITEARMRLPAVIERLLFDPDVRVIETLLGNPRLTEADVLKLSASRRANPEALRAVAQDVRWIARYPIKLALASNPATPADLAAGILPHLLAQDLGLLATAAPRTDTRVMAAALLAARRADRGDCRPAAAPRDIGGAASRSPHDHTE